MDKPSRRALDPTLIAACCARQDRLRQSLNESRVDGLLVSNPRDIQYLTHFVGDDTLLIVDRQSAAIITDSRYDEELDAWRGSGVAEVVMGIRHRLFDTVGTLARSRTLARLAIQSEHLTVAGRGRLADAIGADRVVDRTGLVPALRMRKDDLELRTIEQAIAVQQDALDRALQELTTGMTEADLAASIEYYIRTLGGSGSSFSPIIAAGANSSVIHYGTGRAPIEEGVLLIDWGARVDWHCGDLTRTFAVGSMPREIREVYGIVLEAQQAAVAAAAPGRLCSEIDAVARHIIAAAGYGERFGHGLGHGLGIDVHEDPYFNDLSTVRLEPGMVMTVEPGIYLPGVGGVRIEDDIVITDRGCRVLSSYPRDHDSALLQPASPGGACAGAGRAPQSGVTSGALPGAGTGGPVRAAGATVAAAKGVRR
jgi:Xaa-Pro aminopeptidase